MSAKALGDFKARIRQLTRRSGGRSLEQVVDRLRPYLLGWKAYFGLAQTPRVWRKAGRVAASPTAGDPAYAVKGSKTIYRELRALGASEAVAGQVAGNSRRWWRNSGLLLNSVLTIAYFDRLGVPRLS